MKHQRREPVERVLEWLGASLSEHQWEALETFALWCRTEAVAAGGLGPREGGRVWQRHLADSLAFLCGWPTPPPQILDVGSGVGFPGIPLAVAWPETAVTLLDRSRRRVDLAKRAVRMLRLENIEVKKGDLAEERTEWEAAVFRAVFPWDRALLAASTLLADSGTAAIGLRGTDTSLTATWPDRPLRRIDVPAGILDAPASLLIMGPRER